MTIRTLFLSALVVPFASSAAVPVSPESQGVSSAAILKFIEAVEKVYDGGEMGSFHGFVIRRHGQVIAEGTWSPDDSLTRPHMLYSHSKSFTSTAIGFLVDAGKVDLDERVVDIFADVLPEKISPRMREVRVRDLLTMNVGAAKSDPMMPNEPYGDWVKIFLSNEVERAPGTVFKYDSTATYMLAEIVRRKSGEDLMAFLEPRLFKPLGIVGAWSGTAPNGTSCGGWGMNMTTRDLAKFGQLYLNRGVWNGQRLLSDEWVALATSRQTWSGAIAVANEDGSDWRQGYGFQFWRCRHGAFRADGASGQFTIVLPKEDAVVSISAGLGNMQRELNLVWDNLLPAFGPKPLPEDPPARAALEKKLASLTVPCEPVANTAEPPYPFAAEVASNTIPRMNPFNFVHPTIEKSEAGWVVRENDRALSVGCGSWGLTPWKFGDSLVEPIFYYTMTRTFAASGTWTDPQTFAIRWFMPGGVRYGRLVLKAVAPPASR